MCKNGDIQPLVDIQIDKDTDGLINVKEAMVRKIRQETPQVQINIRSMRVFSCNGLEFLEYDNF